MYRYIRYKQAIYYDNNVIIQMHGLEFNLNL